MGSWGKIPEFLEKRSEFGRKPEFNADMSFASGVEKKKPDVRYFRRSHSDFCMQCHRDLRGR